MAKKVASILNALLLREAKAWKVIDFHLSDSNRVSSKVRQAAAEFILKRIYPEKVLLGGDKENPVRLVIRAAADLSQ